MTGSAIENVIAAQTALIAALDAGDVHAIEQATALLLQHVSVVRGAGAFADVARERVDHALKQTEAARTRVNYLADRTRQRLDQLAERRGQRRQPAYNSAGRLAVFGR